MVPMRPTPEQEAKLAELQQRNRKAAKEFARLAAELGLSDEEIAERLQKIGNYPLQESADGEDAD
jgi:hypothetical protein